MTSAVVVLYPSVVECAPSPGDPGFDPPRRARYLWYSRPAQVGSIRVRARGSASVDTRQ